MIYIDRTRAAPPAVLTSDRARKAFDDAKKFYGEHLTGRLQRRHEFEESIWKHATVRSALTELFNGKCAYCESKLDSADAGDIDAFRPKGGAYGLSGKHDPDHYWWLAYAWRNLYLVCRKCNSYKASKFPVAKDKRAPVPKGDRTLFRAPWFWDELSKAETPLLLDPCSEAITHEDSFFATRSFDAHLTFDPEGFVTGRSEPGKITVDILKLNRPDLVRKRRDALQETMSELVGFGGHLAAEKFLIYDDFKTPLVKMQEPSRPYAAARRQFVLNWLRDKYGTGLFVEFMHVPELREVIGAARSPVPAKAAAKKAKRPKAPARKAPPRSLHETCYVTRVEVHNFRAVEHLDFAVPEPREEGASWLVLLGENGMGKSSILKAVALALMDQERIPLLGLDASSFVRYGCASGYVRVHVTGYEQPFELRFRRGSRRFRKGNANRLKTLLLGYGGTRLLPRGAHKPAPAGRDDGARVANLFDPFLPLIDAEAWLLSLGVKPFGYSARAIKDLLARETEDRLFRRGRRIRLKLAPLEGSVALEELSDGYQSMVALAADVMKLMLKTWEVAEKSQGIVLIDEIDMHLHPRWKLRITRSLRHAFPRVQFLVTTHDPLCLKGTQPGEVYVLNREDEHRRITARQADAPPGATADQLLTGFWFNLSSTLDDETLALIEEHHSLLSARRTPANARLRRYLEDELRRRLGTYSDTSVERIAQSAAAQELRQAVREADDGRGYRGLDAATREKVLERVAARVAEKKKGRS